MIYDDDTGCQLQCYIAKISKPVAGTKGRTLVFGVHGVCITKPTDTIFMCYLLHIIKLN